MVLINTQYRKQYAEIKFKYLADIPNSRCTFGSARDGAGKAYLFLIFSRNKIYARKGIGRLWEELTSDVERYQICERLIEAVQQKVPQFTAGKISLN